MYIRSIRTVLRDLAACPRHDIAFVLQRSFILADLEDAYTTYRTRKEAQGWTTHAAADGYRVIGDDGQIKSCDPDEITAWALAQEADAPF